jgi:aerobic carbon-monoxide dehydrogenase medium subunit
MTMQPFQYRRAESLDEARRLIAEAGEASYVAGGHTLLPAMKLGLSRPATLVDLGGIADLRGVREESGKISIGAMTPHAEVATSAIVKKAIPALAGLASTIGDRHVRNRGTIGGSLANDDPAADYPAAVLGLGATVVTDRREIAADAFFVSLYETALQSGEIIRRVNFPIPVFAGYAKFRSAASRFPIVGVLIARPADGVRVAVTGAGAGGVFRARALEEALAKDFRAEALDGISIDPKALLADLNATPEYRAHLIMIMARRALQNPGRAMSYK